MRHCLYCEHEEVEPEAAAGLCASCEWSVRLGLYAVDHDERGRLVIRTPEATPMNPLGTEGYRDAGKPYLPPESDAGEYAAQLVALLYPRPSRFWQAARAVIADMESAGCEVRIDTQYGRAVLSHPRRVPYPVLVRFVELQTEIEDELTRRTAGLLKSRQEAHAVLASRFGSDEATRVTGFVQLEHFRGADDATQGAATVTGYAETETQVERAQMAARAVRTLQGGQV